MYFEVRVKGDGEVAGNFSFKLGADGHVMVT
jgi:hypothetical protein